MNFIPPSNLCLRPISVYSFASLPFLSGQTLSKFLSSLTFEGRTQHRSPFPHSLLANWSNVTKVSIHGVCRALASPLPCECHEGLPSSKGHASPFRRRLRGAQPREKTFSKLIPRDSSPLKSKALLMKWNYHKSNMGSKLVKIYRSW